jgi:hypothetical protein
MAYIYGRLPSLPFTARRDGSVASAAAFSPINDRDNVPSAYESSNVIYTFDILYALNIYTSLCIFKGDSDVYNTIASSSAFVISDDDDVNEVSISPDFVSFSSSSHDYDREGYNRDKTSSSLTRQTSLAAANAYDGSPDDAFDEVMAERNEANDDNSDCSEDYYNANIRMNTNEALFQSNSYSISSVPAMLPSDLLAIDPLSLPLSTTTSFGTEITGVSTNSPSSVSVMNPMQSIPSHSPSLTQSPTAAAAPAASSRSSERRSTEI